MARLVGIFVREGVGYKWWLLVVVVVVVVIRVRVQRRSVVVDDRMVYFVIWLS